MGSTTSVEAAVDELFDSMVKSRFIEMFGQKEPNESFANCVDNMLKGPFGSDIKKDLFVPKSVDTYKVYIQVNAIQKDQNLGEYYISKDYYNQKMYRFKVDPGDYLITCDGTMGKWIRLDNDIEPGIISASLLKIKIDESILNPRYFESLWEYNMLPSLLSQVRNGCLKHLPSAKVIGNERILLPSLEEQKQFAMFKEQVDKSKVICKRVVSQFDDLVKSRFIEMFGHTDKNEKSFPLLPLNEVSELITDGSHFSPLESPSGQYPMLSVKDMMDDGFDYSGAKRIDEKTYKDLVSNGCQPKSGDVLIAKDGATAFQKGFVLSNSDNQVLLSSIAIIRPDQKVINSHYLLAYLFNESVRQDVLRNRVSGTAITRIILKELKKIKVMVPPIDLQNQFVLFSNEVDKSKFELIRKIENNIVGGHRFG